MWVRDQRLVLSYLQIRHLLDSNGDCHGRGDLLQPPTISGEGTNVALVASDRLVDAVSNSIAAQGGSLTAEAVTVRVVSSATEWRALGSLWSAVFAESATRSPFLAHDWTTTWWNSFGAGQELSILLFEDAHGLAGIAPLALARRGVDPFAYRSLEIIGTGPLRFLGMGLADRADVMLARNGERCLEALVRWLEATRSHWDILDLRFLPDDSLTARLLPALCSAANLGCVVEPCAESPYLPLEGTYEGYLDRRSRNFRKGLRRKLHKLEEGGAVHFDLAAEQSMPVLDAFEQVVLTSRSSWKEEAGSALFMHAPVRDFFHRALPALAERGGLYIALCRVGGRVVAHELGFRMDGKLWSYDSGFRRDFGEGSPGIVLTARLLESSWQQGLVEYDFMRGNEGYKLSWQTAVRRELQLVIDSGTPRGRIARRLAFEGKWALKRNPRLVDLQSRLAGMTNRLLVGSREPT